MNLICMGFEEWCESWTEMFTESGALAVVQPQFDPLEVHMSGNEHMRIELLEEGVDPGSCVYRGKKGCLLPRENRPKICREYMCKDSLAIVGAA